MKTKILLSALAMVLVGCSTTPPPKPMECAKAKLPSSLRIQETATNFRVSQILTTDICVTNITALVYYAHDLNVDRPAAVWWPCRVPQKTERERIILILCAFGFVSNLALLIYSIRRRDWLWALCFTSGVILEVVTFFVA